MDETRKVKAAVWRGALAGLIEEPLPRDAPSEIPTLILWGEADGLFSADDQDALRRHFTNAAFIVYPETGHAPNWERPVEVAAALLQFWRALDTQNRNG